MKTIRKLSAIFLSFCIIFSAIFVMTVSGSQTVNSENDSTDNVVLQQSFEEVDPWVYVETTYTPVNGQNMVFYMKPTDYTNLAGTTVYIDDIVVQETATGTEALNADFEDTNTVTAYYVNGNNRFKNYGVAPQVSNNIPNDPRLTQAVIGTDVGHNGSNGAIQFGYANNPDDTNKAGLPIFRVYNVQNYNGGQVYNPFAFKAETEYKISFYYKAVGINTSLELYVSESDSDLTGYRVAAPVTTNAKKITDVTASTAGKDVAFYSSSNDQYGMAPITGSNNIPNDPRKVCLVNGTGLGNNSDSALQLGYTANPDDTNKGGLPIVKVRNSEDYNSKNTYQAFRFETGETYNISFYYKAVGVNAPLELYVSEYNDSLRGYRAGLSTSTAAQKAQKIVDVSAPTTEWVMVETTYTPTDGQDMVIYMKPTDYTNLAGTIVYIDDVNVAIKDTAPPVEEEDDSILRQGFEEVDPWVYVETTYTPVNGQDMVIYMKPTEYANLAGTTVYIDDIIVKETDTDEEVLNTNFEDTTNDQLYYVTSTNRFNNFGIAPQVSNNIPNDPRLTCLASGTGVGHNGSSSAMQFGYANNPDDSNKAGLPIFKVRNSKQYNGQQTYNQFMFKAGTEYKISFYYKAVGINTPLEIYVSERNDTLAGYRVAAPVTTNAKKITDVTASTAGKDVAFYSSSNDQYGMAPITGSNNIPNDPRKVCFVNGTGLGNNSDSALQLGYTANPDDTNKGGLPIVKVRNSKDYNSKNTYQSFRFEADKTYNISFYYKAVGVNAPLELYVSEYNDSLRGYRAGFSTSAAAQKAQKIGNISDVTTGWVKVETIYTSADGQDMVIYMKPTDYTNLAGTTVYIDDVVVYELDITKPEAPGTPVVQDYSETSVTLEVVDGCEYSIDGVTWQNSNVFDNLTPWDTYTFYQRVRATSTSLASDSTKLEDYVLVFHGDLDKSKKIDSVDLVILRKVLLDVEVEYEQTAADVNKDNEFDIRDLVALKKKLMPINFTINGTDISEFKIVKKHYNESYMVLEEINNLQDEILEKTGYEVPIVEDSYVAEGDYEIIVGNAARQNVTPISDLDEYEVTISDQKVYINGGSDYATGVAVTEFSKLLVEERDLTDDSTLSGNYNETIKGYNKASYYTLAWNDEFNGDELDTSKWRYYEYTDEGKNGKNSSRSSDTFHFDNSTMTIIPTQTEDTYYGGMIWTDKAFTYKYGYLEISAKLPNASGFWTSLWTCGKGHGIAKDNIYLYPEIDVNESYGDGSVVTPNAHSWPGTLGANDGYEHTSYDSVGSEKNRYALDGKTFNDDFHTFGLLWTDKEISFTCDGEIYFTIDTTTNEQDILTYNQHQFIILSLAAGLANGAEMTTNEEDWTNGKANYSVDWIRLYQLDDGKCETSNGFVY